MRQADSPQESMQVETLCAATQVAASSIKNLNKSSHMLYPVPASNEHRHRLNHRNRNGYRMQRLGSGYSKSNDAVPGSFPSANSLSSNCRLDNLIPISLCASSMIAIGSLMLAGGVVVMIFDHMELGPPQFDEQYERYSGSSLSEIVGPLLVTSGSVCIIGNVSLLLYLSYEYYNYQRSKKHYSGDF